MTWRFVAIAEFSLLIIGIVLWISLGGGVDSEPSRSTGGTSDRTERESFPPPRSGPDKPSDNPDPVTLAVRGDTTPEFGDADNQSTMGENSPDCTDLMDSVIEKYHALRDPDDFSDDFKMTAPGGPVRDETKGRDVIEQLVELYGKANFGSVPGSDFEMLPLSNALRGTQPLSVEQISEAFSHWFGSLAGVRDEGAIRTSIREIFDEYFEFMDSTLPHQTESSREYDKWMASQPQLRWENEMNYRLRNQALLELLPPDGRMLVRLRLPPGALEITKNLASRAVKELETWQAENGVVDPDVMEWFRRRTTEKE